MRPRAQRVTALLDGVPESAAAPIRAAQASLQTFWGELGGAEYVRPPPAFFPLPAQN